MNNIYNPIYPAQTNETSQIVTTGTVTTGAVDTVAGPTSWYTFNGLPVSVIPRKKWIEDSGKILHSMLEYLPKNKKDWVIAELITGDYNDADKADLVGKVINMLSPEHQSKFVLAEKDLFYEIIAPDASIEILMT